MNTYLKYFLIGIGVVLGVVILVNVLTPKTILPQSQEELQQKIKQLESVNLELINKQLNQDSVNAQYEEKIQMIEEKLDNVGESKVIIQKIYTDRVKKAQTATPSEVDSFFKQRYNY